MRFMVNKINARGGISSAPTSPFKTRVGRGLLALEAINFAFELYSSGSYAYDMELVRYHLKLFNKAVVDVQKAINSEKIGIPDKYMNSRDLGYITDFVLQGKSNSNDEMIKQIGTKILKEISKNYRFPLKRVGPLHNPSSLPSETTNRVNSGPTLLITPKKQD